MISVSLEPNDTRTLRITAAYFLALAGDDLQASGPAPSIQVIADPTMAQLLDGVPPPAVFNAAELAEAETLAPAPQPTPTTVGFGQTPQVPAVAAPSIAAAAPLPTAPVGTPASISMPTPPVATLPPAPPAPPAATLAAPPTVLPAGGVELDASGLPWDARIHSGERSKLKNGDWKVRRGTDPAVIATVTAELQQMQGLSPALVAPVQSAPPPPPSVPQAASGVMAASPSSPEPATFGALMAYIGESMDVHKNLTDAQLANVLANLGIPNVTALISAPQHVPAVYRSLREAQGL